MTPDNAATPDKAATPAQAAPPPLPDPSELAARSAWLKEWPGLTEAVLDWNTGATAERDRIRIEAAELARPSFRTFPLMALLRMIVRVLWYFASDAGHAVLARTRRRGRVPTTATPEPLPVRWAKHVVRAGGPAYVKLGQLIATAKGPLPEAWSEAFAWCRDEVPALAPGLAEQIMREQLGDAAAGLTDWSDRPMAAASIAQVHSARLADGTAVVVKVQRPGLQEQFMTDIRALSVIGAVADRVSKKARIANLPGFVELFAEVVLEELDFRLEARNMVDVGLATEDAKLGYIRIPRPVPGMVTRQVLVMERVAGVRYTDAARTNPDLDGHKLVRLAVQGVLEHTLLYGVFHGDLHAGNVLIDTDGTSALVDFGICGRVDAAQRAALVRLMIGFARQDAAAQVAAVAEFGALPPDLDLTPVIAEFAAQAPAMLAAFDRPLSQLDLLSLTDQVAMVIRLLAQYRFRQPKELVLFSKNLLYLNGFANAFAPDINLMAEIAPVFLYFQQKYPAEIANMMRGSLLPPAP